MNDSYTLIQTDPFLGTTEATVTAIARTYTGFTFDGNISGTVASGSVAPDSSLVLKLYYNRNSYTLTFNPNNGQGNNVATVRYGATVTAPTYTKTGYNFSGWDTIVVGTMPAANKSYTATWSINSYTIGFNTDGGSAITNYVKNYGDYIYAPTAPTKAGFIFGGWYANINLTTPYTFVTMPAMNIIVYVKWDIDTSSNGYVKMEGENGVLYGGAMSESSGSASNGAHAAFINTVGAGVKFTSMNATSSIILAYASISTGNLGVYVNGVRVGYVSLQASGSYTSIYNLVKVTGLNIKSGDSLAFQFEANNPAFNIDYIAYNVSNETSLISKPIQ